MGPDLLSGDVELTEFVELDVQQVKGVGKGANGFPHLIMKGLAGAGPAVKADADGDDDGDWDECPTCKGTGKIKGGSTVCPNCGGTGKVKAAAKSLPTWHPAAKALVQQLTFCAEAMALVDGPPPALPVAAALFKAVAADGSIDETPDIDGGQQAIALIAKLITYEAQELATGQLGEIRDIGLLCEAASCLKWWLSGEVATEMAGTADTIDIVMDSLVKAKMSTKEMNDLPDSAFAYIEPGHASEKVDGKTPGKYRHFPVHDKAHADNAAARIAQGAKFGDKAKAKVEAAQKRFGESGTSKGTVAESEDGVQTDQELGSRIEKAVGEAVAKVTADSEDRIKAVEERAAKAEAEVAKFAAMPRPGGPVMSTAPASTGSTAKAALIAKADEAERLADQVSDPNEAASFRQLAAQKRTEAEKLP